MKGLYQNDRWGPDPVKLYGLIKRGNMVKALIKHPGGSWDTSDSFYKTAKYVGPLHESVLLQETPYWSWEWVDKTVLHRLPRYL